MASISGEFVPTKRICRILKPALAKRFGQPNVSVTSGRGTGSSWVHADVEVSKPSDCFCVAGQTYCQRCREALQETSAEARKIVRAAMDAKGAKFSTYYGDMDTEENEEFLLQVSFLKPS